MHKKLFWTIFRRTEGSWFAGKLSLGWEFSLSFEYSAHTWYYWSALLKLADIFKQCGNFTKLCVLRVVQQSERHLDKITNVDEFVKRISSVLHSNDPVARALTLRLLGSVAVIIPERKQVKRQIKLRSRFFKWSNCLDCLNCINCLKMQGLGGQNLLPLIRLRIWRWWFWWRSKPWPARPVKKQSGWNVYRSD